MADAELLTGWGRTAPSRATVHRVTAAEAASVISKAGPRGVVARGLGRSYNDAAQNAGGDVVILGADGWLAIDGRAAVVEVGAGVSLERVIREAAPHGLFVPVTPGTRHVTIGGAIAADVHGKNHHVHGSFGQHVERIDLLDAEGQLRSLTAQTTPELFWATIGGMGLTGVVVSARVRLMRVGSFEMVVDTDRAADLEELLALMSTGDDGYTYSVAWIDLLARGRSLGRSVLSRADHAPAAAGGAAAPALRTPVLSAPRWTPDHLVNSWSVRAFNELWYRKAPKKRRGDIQHLTKFFYPLDGIADWNRLYGRAGLLQYQFVVPFGQEPALERMVEEIAASGHASFLAVLKRFGPSSPAFLSFPIPGWTLALDLTASPQAASLLATLDELVLSAEGRVYLAKDSRITAEATARMYSRLSDFQAVRRELDPRGVFVSDLARRIGLATSSGVSA